MNVKLALLQAGSMGSLHSTEAQVPRKQVSLGKTTRFKQAIILWLWIEIPGETYKMVGRAMFRL